MLHAAARWSPGLAAQVKPALLPIIAAASRLAQFSPRDFMLMHWQLARQLSSKTGAAGRLTRAAAQASAPGIGARAIGNRIIMLVVSDLWNDPRVEREALALARAGYLVEVLCPDLANPEGSKPVPEWGEGITIRLIPREAASFCVERPGFIAGHMFDAAMKVIGPKPPLAFHGHDLNTCLAALAAARLTGAHFVADFHEWTSENVHWDPASQAWQPYPEDWKAELQALEARVLREASAVITVCDSIAEALSSELGAGRRVHVIRNIPTLSTVPTKDYPPLKAQLSLPESQFVLLWQGGTGPTRLIEPIIRALEFAPNCVLVIRGPSLDIFGDAYRAVAATAGSADRLILIDPVTSRDVVVAARGADAGIWTLPNLCRNFTYALPNKIFEYTASNLALLVADYPEARRVVDTHSIGLTFEPYEPLSIAAAINRLINEPGLAESFRANTFAALKSIDAEGEWQKLAALYDALPRALQAESRS
ncbi:hypothetical protein ASG72_04005 [Bosea sp. Leaf344]|nr:hypothetical protein ASG72_04005 [Bosea sp. Leaf344]